MVSLTLTLTLALTLALTLTLTLTLTLSLTLTLTRDEGSDAEGLDAEGPGAPTAVCMYLTLGTFATAGGREAGGGGATGR